MRTRILKRSLAAGALVAAVAFLAWMWTSQGPLAPTRVTVAKAERGDLVAKSFGVGTIEARRTYALGPTTASRVLRVLVDQGDAVKAGQLLAELDPVDLEDRVAAARIASERAAASVLAARAQLAEARSRAQLAAASARRAAELREKGFLSHEAADAKGHEDRATRAAEEAAAAQLGVAERERERAAAELSGVSKLRAQARLASPVDGVVSARLVEPGTTVVAGQAVIQVVEPATLWVRSRIDQGQASGIREGLPAEIVLRAEPGRAWRGEVRRVDLVSDAVTEERIVNVDFADRPPAMSIGDLVEVTIRTAQVAGAVSVPSAAVKRVDRREGVWQVSGDGVAFRALRIGLATLDGRSQVLEGLAEGDEVIVHSEKALAPGARVRTVAAIAGAGR